MSIKDALLATIGSEESGIRGRTLLQKRMYFLGVLLKRDFLFAPYYYGPYSLRVANQLGALREAAFVSENTEAYPDPSGPFGGPRRYDYRLTPEGQALADRRTNAVGVYRDVLKKITSHAIADDPRMMATAAKVHFIVSEHGQATGPEIRQRARELGWDVQPGQIDKIVDYLEHLGLIKTRAGRSSHP